MCEKQCYSAMMDDLKEELLDTVAIFREKLNKISIYGWFLILLPFGIWPFLYLLLAFGLVKFIISGFGSIYLVIYFYKKIGND